MIEKLKRFIKFDFSFVLMIIVSLFTSSFISFIISIVIIIVHEFFHLFASLLFKVKPKSITITALGGIIDIPLYKLSPVKKIIVSVSGVISNLLIIIIVYIYKDKIPFFTNYYLFIIEYNFSLIIFSLLPIYPLDGYNLLQGFLEFFYEDNISKGLKISRNTSVILLIIISLLYLYLKNIGFVIIICYLIYKNFLLFKRKDFIYLQTYQKFLIK